MKKHCLLSAMSLLVCSGLMASTADYNVIPLPQSIQLQQGDGFTLSSSTTIVYPTKDKTLKQSADFLAQYIKLSTGLTVGVSDKAKSKNIIALSTNYPSDKKESYQITVDKNKVSIDGSDQAGLFYGIQTLRKSIPAEDSQSILLPQATITDYPRFGYRGMMLDVSRHFFPIEFVKKYVDILALHNMNVLHWHISDDQGWRIEIKKYPKLTQIGSMRSGTLIGHGETSDPKFDNIPHGGFYTRQQIKDLIAYAAARHITVIPEIDMPGHMLAALASYPELGCRGKGYEVCKQWGVFDDVLCVGKQQTMTFLEDVFSEIVELFPSKYIHIGGDECPKVRWKECPVCQAKIESLGLKTDDQHSAEERLQSYVTSHMEKFLNEKGKTIIGWDEILEGGVAPNATIMSWRGTTGGIAAAQLNHDVIMAPNSYLYFDYYQNADSSAEPLAIGGCLTLDKVYSYEPMPAELSAQQQKHIIGVQANLWAEYILDGNHAEYMLLPRADALSEIQWMQSDRRNYDEFITRLKNMTKLYDRIGYNYHAKGYSATK